MGIDIENPGADEAALRAAIGLYSGQVLLLSGAISSPVTFIDLELPAGYIQFKLELYGLHWGSGADAYNFAAALSFDAGDTFLADTGGFDSYLNTSLAVTAAALAGQTEDVLLNFPAMSASSPVGSRVAIDLFPGSATDFAQLSFISSNWVGGVFVQSYGQGSVNPDATVPPSAARANLMRLAVYDGWGEIDPPHVGVQITAGTYRLFGVPA